MLKNVMFLSLFSLINFSYSKALINTEIDLYNFVYQMCWRAHASNYRTNFLFNNRYKASIYNVIAKCIADCIQKRAEFANYTKIVQFVNTNPIKYTNSNWNAVILYNFLAYAIDDRYEKVSIDNDGVEKVGKICKIHYEKQYAKRIDKSIQDIKAYATALNLYDYLKQLVKTDFDDDNKFYKITKKFDYKQNACVEIKNVNIGEAKNINITFEVNNAIITAYIKNKQINLTEDMTIKKTSDYTVPKSDTEIHVLPNFTCIKNDKSVNISDNKCWFNATMLSLYNSRTMQRVVSELVKRANDVKVSPSYWISKIFADIRTGNMSKYGDHLKGLICALKNLRIDCVDTLDSDNESDPYISLYVIINSLITEGKNQYVDLSKNFIIKGTSMIKCSNEHILRTRNVIYDVIQVPNYCDDLNDAYRDMMSTPTSINKCNQCKTAKATRVFKVEQLPPLVIFLYAPIDGEWRSQPFLCPDIIYLQDVEGNHEYKLTGVIKNTAIFGHHYYAELKLGNGRWYCGDSIKEITFNNRSKLFKIVFYERVK